jgi:hypothetical protein
VDSVTVGKVLIRVSNRLDVFKQIIRSYSTHRASCCGDVMTHTICLCPLHGDIRGRIMLLCVGCASTYFLSLPYTVLQSHYLLADAYTFSLEQFHKD